MGESSRFKGVDTVLTTLNFATCIVTRMNKIPVRWAAHVLCLRLLVEANSSCSLCALGNLPIHANKDIGFLVPEASGLLGSSSLSCSMADDLAKEFLEIGDDICQLMQQREGLKEECGCPETLETSNTTFTDQENPTSYGVNNTTEVGPKCSMCPGGYGSLPDPNFVVRRFKGFGLPDGFDCGQLQNLSRFMNPTSIECVALEQYMSFSCGCVDSLAYAGATTEARRALLSWLPRIAGLLSLFGSLYILFDVFKSRQQGHTMYKELLVGISFFDCISSIAFALSSLPVPTTDSYGQEIGAYGARGNAGTCTAQGFFLVLGGTGE